MGVRFKITWATAPCSLQAVPLSFSDANCYLRWLDERQRGNPVQPPLPILDPSVATSTFMVHILLFEFPLRANRLVETGCEMLPATAP